MGLRVYFLGYRESEGPLARVGPAVDAGLMVLSCLGCGSGWGNPKPNRGGEGGG